MVIRHTCNFLSLFFWIFIEKIFFLRFLFYVNLVYSISHVQFIYIIFYLNEQQVNFIALVIFYCDEFTFFRPFIHTFYIRFLLKKITGQFSVSVIFYCDEFTILFLTFYSQFLFHSI